MPDTPDANRAAVEQRFARVARSPDQEQKLPVGPASAKKHGYDPQEIDSLPPAVAESFCGVGNPLGLGEVRPGQTVLDLGSGPGLDSLLAARGGERLEKPHLGPGKDRLYEAPSKGEGMR
jgi:arsenite methyltransferase